MVVRFTRHARDRMRLFRIANADVESVVASPDRRQSEGALVKCFGRMAGKFGARPLLVVVDPRTDPPTVVSTYPYKTRWRRR